MAISIGAIIATTISRFREKQGSRPGQHQSPTAPNTLLIHRRQRLIRPVAHNMGLDAISQSHSIDLMDLDACWGEFASRQSRHLELND
jgi:hypothetical protein